MKLLLSAYACAPGRGSEHEVGLRALDAALREHEVWVLTQPLMAELLRPWLAQHPLGERAHVHSVHPQTPENQAGLATVARIQITHERWQRAAAKQARRLHAEVDFDLAHHVTLAAYWTRTAVADLGVPVVWGPVGGGVETPWGLVTELGWRGAVEDAVRSPTRLAFWLRPQVRQVGRVADVVLVQNQETLRRVRKTVDSGRVLPNALCAEVDPVPVAPRRNDIAVVGRLVAWKAAPLAVRTLSRLADRSVALRVYGEADGPERERLLAAARRYGVADRVELLGRMPRADVMAAMATSGAVLHPSLHDESPLSIAEALRLGTPVVALDHGGPAEVARHWPQATVRLVRPSTPGRTASRLAEAVGEVLDPLRPVPAVPISPDIDFSDELLQAYRQAVRGTGARR